MLITLQLLLLNFIHQLFPHSLEFLTLLPEPDFIIFADVSIPWFSFLPWASLNSAEQPGPSGVTARTTHISCHMMHPDNAILCFASWLHICPDPWHFPFTLSLFGAKCHPFLHKTCLVKKILSDCSLLLTAFIDITHYIDTFYSKELTLLLPFSVLNLGLSRRQTW